MMCLLIYGISHKNNNNKHSSNANETKWQKHVLDILHKSFQFTFISNVFVFLYIYISGNHIDVRCVLVLVFV